MQQVSPVLMSVQLSFCLCVPEKDAADKENALRWDKTSAFTGFGWKWQSSLYAVTYYRFSYFSKQTLTKPAASLIFWYHSRAL